MSYILEIIHISYIYRDYTYLGVVSRHICYVSSELKSDTVK